MTRSYRGRDEQDHLTPDWKTPNPSDFCMIAAVARIFQPGCKVDTVPIFEGAQGARKSTAVKALFDPWFSDELADLGSKDAAMQTKGVWGIEVSELDAMSRMEVSRIKSFITLPAQPVAATQALNLSAGVSNCKVSRGRSFS
jgi:predicted P-loop ATPase